MPERRIATVLMLDVVGSTHIAAQLGDARYRELSSRFARAVRSGLRRFGGREEDNAGDGFFATFSQPDRAIRFATTLADELRDLGIEIRSGIHTGQTESQDGKTQGIAVVIGSRVMSLAGPGEVLVTSTTKELVAGSDFGFEDFSAHELKGVPGTWQVFTVTSLDGEPRAKPLAAAEAARRREAIEPTGPRASRGRLAILAGLVGIVASVGILLAATQDGGSPRRGTGSSAPPSKSVVNVDPETGHILVQIPLRVSQQGGLAGTPPVPVHPIDVGQAAVWTIRSYDLLFRVDPRDGEAEDEILEGGLSAPYNVAVGFDKIWVSCARGLIEVNPATIEQEWVVPLDAVGSQFGADLAVGGGAVWVGVSDGQLIRVDPSTEQWDRWKTHLAPIDSIAFGHGSVWTVDTFGGSVTRYDAGTLEPLATIPIASGVDTLVSGDEAVWALSLGLGVLTEIDVSENRADHIVQAGTSPSGLAAGQGMVWIGHEGGTLRRIDEATRQATDVPFDAEVRALAFDDEADTLWVDVA